MRGFVDLNNPWALKIGVLVYASRPVKAMLDFISLCTASPSDKGDSRWLPNSAELAGTGAKRIGINLNGPMKEPPFWLGPIYQKRHQRLIVLIIHISLSTYPYFTAESSGPGLVRFLQPLLRCATLLAHNSPCALHGVYEMPRLIGLGRPSQPQESHVQQHWFIGTEVINSPYTPTYSTLKISAT